MSVSDVVSPLLALTGLVLIVLGLGGALSRWRLFGSWPAESSLNRRAGIGVVAGGAGILLHAAGRLLESTTGTVLLFAGAVLLLGGIAHTVVLTARSGFHPPD